MIEGENLKKVQSVLTGMLADFDHFCNANGFTYFAVYGTLLGAVRHGGFIPWDDDIDVWMPRDDFQKLITLDKTKLPDGYHIHSWVNDSNYWQPFAKFRKDGTFYNETGTESLDVDHTLWIDIFPLDRCEDPSHLSTKIRTKHIRAVREIQRISALRRCGAVYQVNSLKTTIFSVLSHAKPAELAIKRETLINRCSAETKWLTCYAVSGISYFLKTDIYPAQQLQFGQLTVPVPNHYKNLLTSWYGDYMTLPPVKERVNHASSDFNV